ncbi:hypothetical protein [Haloarcula litorea]|uniref:hypothetical protein n=1 Tax=Haloarcula litorea TaxID=3032579 RepID=UPI0023E88CBE|nr:hypothetical protein [Halomicroarcula sp. GDY20]
MGKDYDSFGDFFNDVAEQYDEMDDTGFDSDESPSLGKFVTDLARAASEASEEDRKEGVEREGIDATQVENRRGERGREIPDPPSLDDIDLGSSDDGMAQKMHSRGLEVADLSPEQVIMLQQRGVIDEHQASMILGGRDVDMPRDDGSPGQEERSEGRDDGSSVSVDEMVDRFQEEMEKNQR